MDDASELKRIARTMYESAQLLMEYGFQSEDVFADSWILFGIAERIEDAKNDPTG